MFTVATISYNQSSFLEQAIQSIVSQLPDGSEYLVMDGGSSDGSQEIIQKYESQITYWQSKPDGGPAAALAAAVDRSTQPYFIYINADDLLLPGSMAYYQQHINPSDQIAVYYADGITLDQSSGKTSVRYSDIWDERQYAIGTCSIVQQSTVLSTEAIRKAGNFRIDNKTCWDGELMFRISRSGGRFKKLDRRTGVFRIHDESITGTGRNLQRYHDDRQAMASELNLKYTPPEQRSLLGKLLSRARSPQNSLMRILARLRTAESIALQ